MPKIAHVALLIETSREYGRGLLRGIMRYQNVHRPWSIRFQPRGSRDPVPAWLKSWHGDGILARIENPAMAKIIRGTGIPAVDLRFKVPRLGLPAVGINNHTVVALALEHLLDRGFRQFAFCGFPPGEFEWMDYRRQLFEERTADLGYPCDTFAPREQESAAPEQEQRRLVRWVRRLKKPVAVMACNDERGLHVLDACRHAGIRVPDEIAVMGVDNDEFLCGLSTPPLTSVDINLEQIGYRAAELLDGLMGGTPPPDGPIMLAAAGVVPRRSSDSYAVDDLELAVALRFLRDHACQGLRMSEITEAVKMERRTLERRMKAALGRSPKEEIIRIQIEEAKRLLTDTDASVKQVAIATGFSSSRYFSRIFRSRQNVSPAQYRQRLRGVLK